MNFQPNPLLYGVDVSFFSSFKLALTMRAPVDHATLSQAVSETMVRYPYFCVRPVQKENQILLQSNPLPVPVFDHNCCVTLGSEACNGHLLAFGCEGNRIFLNASHCIADGMGIDPLLKTVLFLYVSKLYGTEGLKAERILLPGTPVLPEEYAYPFSNVAMEADDCAPLTKAPACAYGTDVAAFDDKGLYAYHLHIPQRAMMEKANPSDGSPVSYLSVMLYRALCALDHAVETPIVVHVQHQYRAALGTPRNRHSLVSYIPVVLPPRAKAWHVERQNTLVRGQIILGSEPDADLQAVSRLLAVFPNHASLTEKQSAMRTYLENSICPKTFGISYVGKMDWCGLERYVEDIHAYLGEKHTKNMILIEVMTIGEDFTVNFMQSGCGDRYVRAFMEQLQTFEIPVRLVGEERYTLCDTTLPE